METQDYAPLRLVVVGKFGAPFGVRGWIKVISFTHPKENILKYLPWVVYLPSAKSVQVKLSPQFSKIQNKNIIVKLPDCETPEIAKKFTNLEISILRDQLPETSKNEYYWHDLEDLRVINLVGEEIGIVEYVFATPANDILVVKKKHNNKIIETLIPYIKHVIIKVDLENKTITVDW